LWANAGPEAEVAAAEPRGPAPPKEERGLLAEEEEDGKGTRGFEEEVELRRSWWWCGAGDAAGEGDGERVEKVGVDEEIWSGRVGAGRQGRRGEWEASRLTSTRDEARWLTVDQRVRAG